MKPGFMATKMTEGLPLNPKLTATPKQAAACYKAFKKQKMWPMFCLLEYYYDDYQEYP
jgi:hypothetical protein